MRGDAWSELLERSYGMQLPAHVRGALDPVEIEHFHRLYADVFRAFCAQGRPEAGLKVFIDRALDPAAREHFVTEPPREGEPLRQWCDRLAGGRTFGVILNNLERYSEEFAASAAGLTAPLLELTGLPLGGLAFLCFMGDYGVTPFGVHKENRGEEGCLFHMGPGTKTFYTWPTERFLELSGGSSLAAATDDLLAEADNVFSLSAGDVVFIPAEVYHVADTPEFSLSMVLDFINPPVERFTRGMLQRILDEDAPPIGPPYTQTIRPATAEDDISAVAAACDTADELRAAIDDHVLRLRSNSGYTHPAPQVTSAPPWTMDTPFRAVAPFPLLSRERGGETVDVFARGHRRAVDAHPRLSEWLQRVNTGEPVTVEGTAELFAPEWTLQETLRLFATLHGLAALRPADG